MKHRVAGRKLGRTSEHRLAVLRNLSTALFDKERIRTTLAKAKELRPFAERLLTISKRETLHARRRVLRHIHDTRVVAKMFDTLSARYAQRPGGYTRVLRLGPRRGDAAEMAIIDDGARAGGGGRPRAGEGAEEQ
jgi:large subunit ribosomal protein L17